MPVYGFRSIKQITDEIKTDFGFPRSLNFKIFNKNSKIMINQKVRIRVRLQPKFTADMPRRVKSFCDELSNRLGVRLDARVEIHYGGHRMHGYRSLASLT